MKDVAILNLKQFDFFFVIVFQCKWVSGVDTYEAEIVADSIIWELFARKSAECLNLHNSFITISSNGHDNDRLSRLPILASPGTMKFSSTLFQATLVLGITVILLLPPQAQVLESYLMF